VRSDRPFLEGEIRRSPPQPQQAPVALDLEVTKGREALLRLAASAVVLVENLRPGGHAQARTGLRHPCTPPRPGWLYAVRVPAGARTARLAALPGLDHGAGPRRPDEHHRHPLGRSHQGRVPICDLVSRCTSRSPSRRRCAERDRTGVGQTIDVSLFEAGVSFGMGGGASTSHRRGGADRSVRHTRPARPTKRYAPPTRPCHPRAVTRRPDPLCEVLGLTACSATNDTSTLCPHVTPGVLIASIEAGPPPGPARTCRGAGRGRGSVRAHRELRRGFQRRTPGRAGLFWTPRTR